MLGTAAKWGFAAGAFASLATTFLAAQDPEIVRLVGAEGAVMLGVWSGLLYGVLAGGGTLLIAWSVLFIRRRLRTREGTNDPR